MRYLVTGCAGFIGRHLVTTLAEQGHTVQGLDIREPDFAFPGRFVRASVTDRSSVRALMHRTEGVFHLAAVVGFANVMRRMRSTILTNTEGTAVLLEAAHIAGAKVLLTSTSACYGRAATNDAPAVEGQDGILGPTTMGSWSYAYAKAADECLAFAYAQECDLRVVVTRLFNVVGHGQSAAAGFVLPRFIEAAVGGHSLDVHAPGTQARTFLDVRDCVAYLVALMASTEAEGQLVNVGGAERLTMKDLARLVVSLVPDSQSEVRLVPPPYGPGYDNVTDRRPSLLKLRGLVPQVTPRPLTDTIRDGIPVSV